MNYRRLGRSGLNVSVMTLGTMNFGNPTTKSVAFDIMTAALDQGINLFDCADVYAGGESERILGEYVKMQGVRQEILVTSKVFNRTGPSPNDMGNSRHNIVQGCEASLRRLQMDYIDIYFLHRTDFNVPHEETLAALDLLVRQGKVRYVACSTHPSWRTAEGLTLADRYGYPKFVCEQPPYNLLDRRIENEIVPMCQHFDLGILAWGPLAQGMLAGRYTSASDFPEGSRAARRSVYSDRVTTAGIEIGEKLADLAETKGCTVAQLAVSWVLCQSGITSTILGPRTLDHFESLLPALEIELDESDFAFFDRLVAPGAHVANFFNTSGWMR